MWALGRFSFSSSQIVMTVVLEIIVNYVLMWGLGSKDQITTTRSQ